MPGKFEKKADVPEKFMTYTGHSMNPTFKAGDRLVVIPYSGNKIRCGDIIVFTSPGKDRKIAHRVSSINSQRIRTKGDNNNNIDPWILSPDRIIGRVFYLQRGRRLKKVSDGRKGHLLAEWHRTIHLFDSRLSCLFGPFYRSAARTGIFRCLLPQRMKTRILSFRTEKGREFQLLMGGLVVGRLSAGETRWRIRRPFRLFIEEESLPSRESSERIEK